jgi:predicted TIM-barrel fold metal-dependent hydrolase
MELAMSWKLSSDSHVVEPPDLFTSRVPAKFRDLVPQHEHTDEADWVVIGGERTILSASQSDQAGLRFEGGVDALEADGTFADVRLGGYIPEENLRENEQDGVWGSVLYPSTGLVIFSFADGELMDACARAFNDWMAEFCATAPSRLKGIGIINVDDVDAAVLELERAHGLGLSGVAITVSPLPEQQYDLPMYEPLWEAAEALGMPLSFHIGTNRNTDELNYEFTRAGNATTDVYVRNSIARMIFGKVFERHPGLRVVSVEHETGWAPYFLNRLDYAYTERRHYDGRMMFADDMLPSDFFRRSVFLSFQEDPIGIELRHRIGVENLLWGSDYPHAESTFPRSQEILDRIMVGVSDEDRTKITCENTAALYGFSVPTAVEQLV